MRRELLGGLSAVALVGGGLLMSPATSAVVGTAGDSRCNTAGASARMAEGHSKWRDPNHLTRKQAAGMESRMARLLDRKGIETTARPAGSVKVPVHVHVIMKKDGKGNISNKRIDRQIKVLNNAFAGRTAPKASDTPFRFKLKSVNRVKNNDWYSLDGEDSQAAKRALRKGDARHLNIYTANLDGGLLGYATFPEWYKKQPKMDGVVLLDESLPGGNADFGPGAVYNKGDTGTHEVGHWMNLYHTFQGSCSELNDYVVDTPWQKADSNIFECDPTLNTCGDPDNGRTDPVQNFMNYVDDPCMNKFTRGQRDRMNISWYIRQALS